MRFLSAATGSKIPWDLRQKHVKCSSKASCRWHAAGYRLLFHVCHAAISLEVESAFRLDLIIRYTSRVEYSLRVCLCAAVGANRFYSAQEFDHNIVGSHADFEAIDLRV